MRPPRTAEQSGPRSSISCAIAGWPKVSGTRPTGEHAYTHHRSHPARRRPITHRTSYDDGDRAAADKSRIDTVDPAEDMAFGKTYTFDENWTATRNAPHAWARAPGPARNPPRAPTCPHQGRRNVSRPSNATRGSLPRPATARTATSRSPSSRSWPPPRPPAPSSPAASLTWSRCVAPERTGRQGPAGHIASFSHFASTLQAEAPRAKSANTATTWSRSRSTQR